MSLSLPSPRTHPLAFLLVMDGAVLTTVVFFQRHNSPEENSSAEEKHRPCFQNPLVFLFSAPPCHQVCLRDLEEEPGRQEPAGSLFDCLF